MLLLITDSLPMILCSLASAEFGEAATMLLSWLEKGYVSNKNSNRFFSMLHSVNSSVRRLVGTFPKNPFNSHPDRIYQSSYNARLYILCKHLGLKGF